MQIRSMYLGLWFVALAALQPACAVDAANSNGELGEETELAADREAATAENQALCVGWSELGTWYRRAGGGPYRIDVWYGGACNLFATVWEKQSDGSLYWRGDFPAHREVLSDGSGWIVPDPIWVGGYIEHLWLHSVDSSSVRVWIYYESVDSKPDAVEDTVYRSTPPLDIFTPPRFRLF
jgi:hypothetical protein